MWPKSSRKPHELSHFVTSLMNLLSIHWFPLFKKKETIKIGPSFLAPRKINGALHCLMHCFIGYQDLFFMTMLFPNFLLHQDLTSMNVDTPLNKLLILVEWNVDGTKLNFKTNQPPMFLEFFKIRFNEFKKLFLTPHWKFFFLFKL
jgi:hypothetical protein